MLSNSQRIQVFYLEQLEYQNMLTRRFALPSTNCFRGFGFFKLSGSSNLAMIMAYLRRKSRRSLRGRRHVFTHIILRTVKDMVFEFSDEAPCDFSFVDAGDNGLAADFVGPPYDSIFITFQAEAPHGADNFDFLLNFLATFLEIFPTYREMVVSLPWFVLMFVFTKSIQISCLPGCLDLCSWEKASGEAQQAQVPSEGKFVYWITFIILSIQSILAGLGRRRSQSSA